MGLNNTSKNESIKIRILNVKNNSKLLTYKQLKRIPEVGETINKNLK